MLRAVRLGVVVVATHLLLALPAAAQDDGDGGIDVRSPGDDGITILPRPNSGRAPETPGDPGGWQQLTLLAMIVVALAVIALLVIRQSRRSRAGARR